MPEIGRPTLEIGRRSGVDYLKGLVRVRRRLASAMRISSLYLQRRSVREREPVLIWPVPRPTARWAIEVSSVSPER